MHCLVGSVYFCSHFRGIVTVSALVFCIKLLIQFNFKIVTAPSCLLSKVRNYFQLYFDCFLVVPKCVDQATFIYRPLLSNLRRQYCHLLASFKVYDLSSSCFLHFCHGYILKLQSGECQEALPLRCHDLSGDPRLRQIFFT